MKKKSFYKSLFLQVLFGMFAGIAIGHFYPKLGVDLKPLGTTFINLIKMGIGPIIFCTVSVGIANMESMKQVGTLGGKTILYFEIITTVALIIGMVVANVVQPGVGLNADPATLDATLASQFTSKVKPQSTMEFIFHIIPVNVVDAFAKGDILQVLLFSVLFGFSLSALGERGKPIIRILEGFCHTLLGIVGLVMKVAPFGAMGAMAFTIGKYGVGTLAQLGQLVLCMYITCFLFIGVILGGICHFFGKISLWKLLKYIKEEIFITLGTSTTEAVFPRMLVKLEKLGCPKSTVGLVLPIGYSFNLDGAAIYLTMAALFIAQATNTHLGFEQQVGLLAIMLLTSKGGAGVAGAALVALAATLSSTDVLPVAGIALVIGVDSILNGVRAVTNLVGNAVATVVVSNWEKNFDHQRASDVLNGRIDIEAELENPSESIMPLPDNDSVIQGKVAM